MVSHDFSIDAVAVDVLQVAAVLAAVDHHPGTDALHLEPNEHPSVDALVEAQRLTNLSDDEIALGPEIAEAPNVRAVDAQLCGWLVVGDDAPTIFLDEVRD